MSGSLNLAYVRHSANGCDVIASLPKAERQRSKGNRRPDDWLGDIFRSRVSAAGVPGSGVLVRVQVQDLHFIPHPHLNLITRIRNLRAETWDLEVPLTFALRTARGAVPTYVRYWRLAVGGWEHSKTVMS